MIPGHRGERARPDPEAESRGEDEPVTRILDRDAPPPADCVPTVVTVTVTVYTPRRDDVDHHDATQDVTAAIRAALAHDFPGVAALRVIRSMRRP
jgi:hypothetical protein